MLKDKFGIEVNVDDTICFTLNLRKDYKPIVKAVISGVLPYGNSFMVVCEYIENEDVARARKENKLPQMVSVERVVKCY